jgi:hypothetical protein
MQALWLLVLRAVCQRGDSNRIDPAAVEAAYSAKDYAACARMFAHLAEQQPDHRGQWLYGRACCLVLIGERDAAFDEIERAVAVGWHDRAHTERDDDLRDLHADSRWAPLLETIDREQARVDGSVGDPALRRELLAMREEDQAARMALVHGDDQDPTLRERMRAIDTKNTARMKSILAQIGWLTEVLVGRDGGAPPGCSSSTPI